MYRNLNFTTDKFMTRKDMTVPNSQCQNTAAMNASHQTCQNETSEINCFYGNIASMRSLFLYLFIYCSIPECFVFTYTSVIKAEVWETFWQGISLWLTTLPSHCESCQAACIYCWPAVMTLTQRSGWAAIWSLLPHSWPTLQGSFQSMCGCVFGGWAGGLRGCVCLRACIHTWAVFIGEALSSHICTSLILWETSPHFHQAAWESGK